MFNGEEKDLLVNVLSTEAGRELLRVFEKKIINTETFNDNAITAAYLQGSISVLRNIIRVVKKGEKDDRGSSTE